MNIDEIIFFFLLISIVLSIFYGAYLYRKLVFTHKYDLVLNWFLLFVGIHILYVIFIHYFLVDNLFLVEAVPFSLLYILFYKFVIDLAGNKSFKSSQLVVHFIPAIFFFIFFFVLLSNEELFIRYNGFFKNALRGISAVLLLFYGIYGFFILHVRMDNIDDRRFKKLIIDTSLIMTIASVVFFSSLFTNENNENNENILMLDGSYFIYLLILIVVLSVNRVWSYRYFEENDATIEDDSKVEQLDKYSKSRIKDSNLEESIMLLEEIEILIYIDVDLNLDKLAQHLRISRYDLSQVFSIGLKTSFSKYVNKKRCEYACELLLRRKETNDSIEDIALQSGFNSNTTFYRAFRENFGVPPSRYS